MNERKEWLKLLEKKRREKKEKRRRKRIESTTKWSRNLAIY